MVWLLFAKPGHSVKVKSSMVEMETGKVKQMKFHSEEAVSMALAHYIASLSHKFIKEKGSFAVVLSGGSLIHSMRNLVEPPTSDNIDWAKWLIFWLDERVVPLDDPDSNYKLAYDGFLSKVPIPHDNIYVIDDHLSPEEAADDYEARLRQLVDKKVIGLSKASRFPKFDLMLLGMGPDGHVASLFPWLYQRYEKERRVTFVEDSPKPPPARITMTFPVINSASEIALVVTGPEVAHAVKVALGCHASDLIPLPVQMVSPEGRLTWFLDKDALSHLPICEDRLKSIQMSNRLLIGLGFLALMVSFVLHFS